MQNVYRPLVARRGNQLVIYPGLLGLAEDQPAPTGFDAILNKLKSNVEIAGLQIPVWALAGGAALLFFTSKGR